ncbi:MAG TPA: sialidase family protein [Bacteroidales bacterium]|nr:sialidase family protein [Bacteroidales bacterium]
MLKIPKSLFLFFSILSFLFITSCIQNNEPIIIEHLVVHQEDGYFMGWPANNGVWMWEDGEIMVGFTRGPFMGKEGHDVEPPYQSWLARSKDGGHTWKSFIPEGFVNAYDPAGLSGDSMLAMKELTEPLDFKNVNFALRMVGNGYLQPDVSEGGFYYSYDRGGSWDGPFSLKGLSQTVELEGMDLTPRTDYIVESADSALLFLSARNKGFGSDKSFVARTTDGGLTFKFIGWIADPKDPYRAVMPSTVRTSSGKLITALRRKNIGIDPYCWIEVFASDDNGVNWKFLSRAGETGWANGNPPAMIQLSDGRLLLAYGNREHRLVIARFSSDEGGIWGPEIMLREGIDQDFGYPRLVQNLEGNIVSIYYCAESPTSEKYIEATIWNPGNADKWGKPIDISSK